MILATIITAFCWLGQTADAVQLWFGGENGMEWVLREGYVEDVSGPGGWGPEQDVVVRIEWYSGPPYEYMCHSSIRCDIVIDPCPTADLDFDGDVDLEDFAIFQTSFGE